MSKINEKAYIALYNQLDESGKCRYSSADLAEMFNFGSERTAQKYERDLRRKGKIKFRKDIEISQPTVVTNDAPIVTPVDWTLPKPKKGSTKKKPFKSYMVIGDAHVPFQNSTAVKVVLSIMDDNDFDGIINLGDFMDMSPISHWNKK